MQANYHANRLSIWLRKKEAHASNPSPAKRRMREAYNLHPSPIKRRVLKAYFETHDINKRTRRQLYKDNRVLDKRRISKLLACSIFSKYSKICSDGPATNTAAYIYRLVKKMTGTSHVAKHTTAQHLVNTCKQYRRFHKADFTKQFHSLCTKVIAILAKATETSTDNEVSDVLCGPSLHTSNTESYYPDTTYTGAAFDEDGHVLRHKFPEHSMNESGNGTETWKCSTELCIMPPEDSMIEVLCDTYSSIAESDPKDALSLVEHIDDCTKPYTYDTKLHGHNKECHVDPHACGSKLLYLHHLAPHFPNIRTIVNMLYTVGKTVTSITKIDKAF